MYDLLDMKLMQYANEELTLGAVATRASLSLAAVSIRLTKLEAVIGNQLLYRTSGNLRLTPAGKRFLKSAAIILKEADILSADLDAIKFGKTARLKIMCNASLAIDDLPLVIDRLESEFPTLYIEINEGSFPDIRRAVMDGSADVGLIASPAPVPGLDFVRYKSDRLVLLVPADHPLAQNSEREIPFSNGLPYDFIGVDDSKYIRGLADKVAMDHNTRIHYRAIVSSFETQCTLVGNTHMGIALVLETIAKRYISTTHARMLQLTDEWASGDFAICARDIEHAPVVIRRFVDLMQMRFNRIDDMSLLIQKAI